MLTIRPTLRVLRTTPIKLSVYALSSNSVTAASSSENAVETVTERREKMTKYDRNMVFGTIGEHMPAPVLPENPSELSALDPVDLGSRLMMDGTPRTVVIRQQKKSTRQSPLNPEASWRLFFYEDGTLAEKWKNPLMGWTSSADPYQFGPPITFQNAAEAVYFAKKRGWNYVVKKPILRFARRDGAQYQDNFLPQAIASKVKREGTSCVEWQRDSAATSHYFRPLKYHGDGLVRQHGPTGEAPIAPHVEGMYKSR